MEGWGGHRGQGRGSVLHFPWESADPCALGEEEGSPRDQALGPCRW